MLVLQDIRLILSQSFLFLITTLKKFRSLFLIKNSCVMKDAVTFSIKVVKIRSSLGKDINQRFLCGVLTEREDAVVNPRGASSTSIGV
jgi:hypothetical protein